MLNKKRIFVTILIIAIALSYGKWEYLSYKHSAEFVEPIKSDLEFGCIALEEPQKIKVISYSEDSAKIFMKGISKSTYIIRFRKNDNNQWTSRKKIDEDWVCKVWILNSTGGGSADQWLYWYF